MKKAIVVGLLCAMPLAVQADPEQLKAEAKGIVGPFFEELKGELGKGMKEGGPVNAIGVCNTVAPAIAKKHSETSGWSVARTSLKLRNPNNAPDAWEQQMLTKFEERLAAGESPDTLAAATVVEENGKKTFRFMKAIVMPPLDKMPCLKCHGENIEPAVKAKLDELYPQDQATGYKAGQVRGAFTLKKAL